MSPKKRFDTKRYKDFSNFFESQKLFLLGICEQKSSTNRNVENMEFGDKKTKFGEIKKFHLFFFVGSIRVTSVCTSICILSWKSTKNLLLWDLRLWQNVCCRRFLKGEPLSYSFILKIALFCTFIHKSSPYLPFSISRFCRQISIFVVEFLLSFTIFGTKSHMWWQFFRQMEFFDGILCL